MRAQVLGIDAVGVADRAGVVLHRQQLRPLWRQQPRGPRADVAEALDEVRRLAQVHLVIGCPLLHDVDHALPGGLIAAYAAAELDRLARHHVIGAMPVQRGHGRQVGVEHPGHDLCVSIHIGGRNVVVGADVIAQCEGEAASDAFQLGLRVAARVELDPAFRPAHRDVGDSGFPGHPGRQRAHLVNVDVGMVAEPAFEGAKHVRVLNAIAGKDLDVFVVHLDRERDGHLVHRLGQDGADVWVELHQIGGPVELLRDVLVHAALRRHGGPPRHKLSG